MAVEKLEAAEEIGALLGAFTSALDDTFMDGLRRLKGFSPSG